MLCGMDPLESLTWGEFGVVTAIWAALGVVCWTLDLIYRRIRYKSRRDRDFYLPL